MRNAGRSTRRTTSPSACPCPKRHHPARRAGARLRAAGVPPANVSPPRPRQAIPPRPPPRLPRARVLVLRGVHGAAAVFCRAAASSPSICAFGFICGGLTLFVLLAGALLGARIEEQLGERVAQVDDWHNFESSFIYDRYGEVLYESFSEGRRTYVALRDIPQSLIDATLATEDDTFFSNPGIDVAATLRAFLQYTGLVRGWSGGSTITQQVVRNLLFTPERRTERSIERKLEEIALALVLTQRKSKEDILELYLNEIYYGNLAYGAQAAASTFFNKDVSRLTLGEAAMLAGLPQAPASLDPLNPESEVQEAVDLRWRIVLDRMLTEGFIDEAQRNQAFSAGLAFDTPDVPFRAPHFTVYVQSKLEQLLRGLGYGPELLANGGLKVYTTLDLRINDLAQASIQQQIVRLAGNNVHNGAVLVTRPDSGEILAMVGSADYHEDSIDGRVNVTTALRQPGSTVKPMTYAAALELGMSPAEILWDTKLDVRGPRRPAGLAAQLRQPLPRPAAHAPGPRQQLQHPRRDHAAPHRRPAPAGNHAALRREQPRHRRRALRPRADPRRRRYHAAGADAGLWHLRQRGRPRAPAVHPLRARQQ